MRWISWFLFLFLAAAALHAYFWFRFVRDTRLSKRWTRAFAGIAIAVTSLIPLAAVLRRYFSWPRDGWIFLLIITWMAVLFFLVSLRMSAGAGLWCWSAGRFLRHKPPFDPERRLFLSRAAAAGTLAIGVPTIIYGTYKGFEDPEWREVLVKLGRPENRHHGFTIVQWTDLHVTRWSPEGFVKRLVERTNAIQPDIVVITGDMVDGSVSQIAPQLASIRDLTSKYGTFFVTGNHEYYMGVEEWIPAIQSLNVSVLTNSGQSIADAVFLAGIPDRTSRQMGGTEAANPAAAMAGRPDHLPAVLLAHQPRDIHETSKTGVDLQISGHTHGGQIWPFGALVMSVQPYLAGLHPHGQSQIYVSRGTGTWGVPIRIAAPAELTKIVLI